MPEAEVEDGAMVDVLRSLDVLDVKLGVADSEDVVEGTITYIRNHTIHIVKPVKTSQPSELPCNILLCLQLHCVRITFDVYMHNTPQH